MKIQHIEHTETFFELVDRCGGAVELVTENGDRLNLKSKLSQCVALANIFSKPDAGQWELVVSDPQDQESLEAFFSAQEGGLA